jgi:hypothetical protein
MRGLGRTIGQDQALVLAIDLVEETTGREGVKVGSAVDGTIVDSIGTTEGHGTMGIEDEMRVLGGAGGTMMAGDGRRMALEEIGSGAVAVGIHIFLDGMMTGRESGHTHPRIGGMIRRSVGGVMRRP